MMRLSLGVFPLLAALGSAPLACQGAHVSDAPMSDDSGSASFDAADAPAIDGADAYERDADASDAADSYGDAASDASDASDAIAASCPSAHGPAMVRVPVTGGAPYCIDSTEVTVAHFDEFLRAGGRPFDAPSFCAPEASTRPLPNDTPEEQSLPITHMTWCYASAYCHWAGKRLCGKIGGGHVLYETPDDQDEWTYACRAGDSAYPYPYGVTYDPAACQTESDAGTLVASRASCHGKGAPFDRIFDMVGNAAELQDYTFPDYVADAGGADATPDNTRSRGGWSGLGKEATCGRRDDYGVGTSFSEVGFRCCADAP